MPVGPTFLSTPVYHYEYAALHAERIQLVRRIHQWYQIGIPVALALFSASAHFAITKDIAAPLVIGTTFSISILAFVWCHGLMIDRGIRRLYPRLIALELVLDFHMWRSYIKDIGPKSKEYAFVEACEMIAKAEGSSDLSMDKIWDATERLFIPRDFSCLRRGHNVLLWAITILAACLIAASLALYYWGVK